MVVVHEEKGQSAIAVACAFQTTKEQTVKHLFLAHLGENIRCLVLMAYSKEIWSRTIAIVSALRDE